MEGWIGRISNRLSTFSVIMSAFGLRSDVFPTPDKTPTERPSLAFLPIPRSALVSPTTTVSLGDTPSWRHMLSALSAAGLGTLTKSSPQTDASTRSSTPKRARWTSVGILASEVHTPTLIPDSLKLLKRVLVHRETATGVSSTSASIHTSLVISLASDSLNPKSSWTHLCTAALISGCAAQAMMEVSPLTLPSAASYPKQSAMASWALGPHRATHRAIRSSAHLDHVESKEISVPSLSKITSLTACSCSWQV
mmetsp:Transcript_1337/g.2233  ORF Transcript_1337/g.2233 Transcript_1337/m.2233 type:complete len:252 (+) Transcript_1337:244-999(+)